jgi:ribosomal protein S18 acetylase RimI-like enzyme
MSWDLVRDSNKDEILAFLKVVSDTFYPPLNSRVDLHDYSEKLANDAINYFLVIDGRRIAHAAYYCNDFLGKVAFISSISIFKEFYGSGAASFIFEKVVESCKENGMKMIRLEVDDQNVKAVRFYRKQGFKHNEAGLMEKIIS